MKKHPLPLPPSPVKPSKRTYFDNDRYSHEIMLKIVDGDKRVEIK